MDIPLNRGQITIIIDALKTRYDMVDRGDARATDEWRYNVETLIEYLSNCREPNTSKE